jgi:16S rRNA (adenine1518-N6/adenine1519-N6)-dimethyltransferase
VSAEFNAALHLRPKRSLGQNFLRDENIARKIVRAMGPGIEDIVVEIGPGEGVLTKHLIPMVRRLIAVEIDPRAVERLSNELHARQLEIVQGDFLEFDLQNVRRRFRTPIRVIGNIPYRITTPILFYLLDNRDHVADIMLMLQREVAERLVARPGTKDYGILSVFFQCFTDVRKLFDVSPNAFFPKPSVVSSVVYFSPLQHPRCSMVDEQFFRAMVRSVFGKRRKTLRNSLRYFLDGQEPDPVAAGIDLRSRPEDLAIEELVDLSNRLFEWRSVGAEK